jgi:hypothetical protein
MKMIDYISKEEFISTLRDSYLISEMQDAKLAGEIYDRFYSYMQHATSRVDIYNAILAALLVNNIDTDDIKDITDCAGYIMCCLPAHPVIYNGQFIEEWEVPQEKKVSVKSISSLEDRVSKLEKLVKELQAETKLNYCGRM